MIIYISWFVTRPYSNTTQCLRTLASPKGRGGMLSGRLKYIIKKNFQSPSEKYIFSPSIDTSFFDSIVPFLPDFFLFKYLFYPFTPIFHFFLPFFPFFFLFLPFFLFPAFLPFSRLSSFFPPFFLFPLSSFFLTFPPFFSSLF
jgi:hypothetical protein